MNLIKNLTFATLALGLVFQAPAKQAANSSPLRLTFEKSFAGGGPAGYLFHFAGSFDGDLTGTLFTGVRVLEPVDRKGNILHLEADYVFSDAHGNYLFTASVAGNSNAHTGKAVLVGEVSGGAYDGAQVHVEFDDLGGGTYRGTVRVMHAGGH
ncbi:MAG: hypothetical protein ABIZ81_04680 [Opitutaceae bacterium]